MDEKRAPEGLPAPAAWESRAFFAALLAACRNDDATAGEILRSIASSMTREFSKAEPEAPKRARG